MSAANVLGRLGAVLLLCLAGMPARGTAAPGSAPQRVGSGTDWAQVSVGAHTCAVRIDRSLWCWGSDLDGHLGAGATTVRGVPVMYRAAGRWKSVEVDGYSTCGVLADASIWCSGFIDRMQTYEPQKVGVGSAWTGVSIAFDESCGLRTDASIWCWGHPPGRYQNSPGYGYTPRPATVPPGRRWASVAAPCARDTGSRIWCWSLDGPPTSPADLPAAITVDVGGNTHCAVTTGHELWCWGDNDRGQLGIGTTDESRATPTRVGTGRDWSDVSVGAGHVCGIRTDASLWCWGAAGRGLGADVTTDQRTPIRVRSQAGWLDVSAGSDRSCGIRNDHSLWCW